MSLECASCGAPIPRSPIERRPYWCPRCGADLKTRKGERLPEPVLAAATPVAPELAELPADYAKKWSPTLPAKSKVPPAPVVTAVFTTETPERTPVPPPSSHVPANVPPPSPPKKTIPAPSLPTSQHKTASLIMAALFLVMSGFLALRSADMALRFQQTTGKIVGFDEVKTSKRTALYPVFTYQVGGKTYKMTSPNSMGLIYGHYQRGQPVKVRYLPSDPSNGGLDSFRERWLGSIITGVFGLASLAGWKWLPAGKKISPPSEPVLTPTSTGTADPNPA